MKQTIIKASTIAGAAGLFLLCAGISLAATVSLTNGGLGQVAANPTQFGVAVCAGADQALSQSVPVTVTANGKSETVQSAASITAGNCEYSYVPYSDFNMQGNQTYSVQVAIDPQHTVSSNSDNATSYSVTVPPQAGGTAVATQPNNQTANVSTQVSWNPFVWLWNWLGNLFRAF